MKKGENAGRAQARKINQIYTKETKDEDFTIRNEVAIRSSAAFSELYSSLPGKCTAEVRKVANSGSQWFHMFCNAVYKPGLIQALS